MAKRTILLFVLLVAFTILAAGIFLKIKANDMEQTNELTAAFEAGAEVIAETTVGDLGGVSVGVGNYYDNDGSPEVSLYPEGADRFTVKVGDRFSVGGRGYLVHSLGRGSDGLGWVAVLPE